jgi:REP element-mobilizing transposase RayT
MTEAQVSLSAVERQVVLEEILRSCEFEGWLLHAAHVRSTHVHLVVTAKAAPEKVTHGLKSYATRALNQSFGRKAKRWATHGSMVWLWDVGRLDRAVDYVVRGQGEAMALFVNFSEWPEYCE